MSVPASKRSLSDREFYHNAIAIRVEVTKRMPRAVADGRLDAAAVERSYQSWRGSLVGLDAYNTITVMDITYKRLVKGA